MRAFQDFPYKWLIVGPSLWVCAIGGASYTAARLVCQNTDDPHLVGVAAGVVAVAGSLTYLGGKALEVLRDVGVARAEANKAMADAIYHRANQAEPAPDGFVPLNAEARAYVVTDETGMNWILKVTPDQWKALARRMEQGKFGLVINELSGGVHTKKPFTRPELEAFRDAAVEAHLAKKNGANEVTLTKAGQYVVRYFAAGNTYPCPVASMNTVYAGA